ncbi:MAG: sensor histidine kinase [Acidimicrobiales bacterium]
MVATHAQHDEGDAWVRFAGQLPTATAAVLLIASAIALTSWSAGRPVVLVIAPALAFAGWQAVWRPWRPKASMTNRASLTWGVGTIALWTLLTLIDPVFYLLLFVLFSLVFTVAPIRIASGLALLLTIAIASVNVSGSTDAGAAIGLVLVALVSGAMAVLLGRWIHGIIEQSRERDALIEQLEHTRAELAESERSAGALTERAHLAAEIHDTLAQGFISIVVLLEAVRANLDIAASESALRRLDLAVETARTNLAEARHLVADLGPPVLTDSSLPDALRRVAADHREATGATVEVSVVGETQRLTADQEVAMLRVAQESLANVRRHAEAASVAITLTYPPGGGVELDVGDDGRGFDTTCTANGFGLRGMADRVRPHGGEVSIESIGSGTRVEARLP